MSSRFFSFEFRRVLLLRVRSNRLLTPSAAPSSSFSDTSFTSLKTGLPRREGRKLLLRRSSTFTDSFVASSCSSSFRPGLIFAFAFSVSGLRLPPKSLRHLYSSSRLCFASYPRSHPASHFHDSRSFALFLFSLVLLTQTPVADNIFLLFLRRTSPPALPPSSRPLQSTRNYPFPLPRSRPLQVLLSRLGRPRGRSHHVQSFQRIYKSRLGSQGYSGGDSKILFR